MEVKLTEEQILELKEMFPACPNPIYYPRAFMFYVHMYLYYKE